MMNYYKIKRTDAERLGIDIYAHHVSATLVVVSDMDIRGRVGFDKSPEEIQAQLGVEPLTPMQLANVKRDSHWSLYKGE